MTEQAGFWRLRGAETARRGLEPVPCWERRPDGYRGAFIVNRDAHRWYMEGYNDPERWVSPSPEFAPAFREGEWEPPADVAQKKREGLMNPKPEAEAVAGGGRLL